MEFDPKNACCFTGHRPERLSAPEEKVIKWLEEQIRRAYNEGYRVFVSGMQRGVDIWAAEIVLKMKKEGLPVQLVAACAFKGMENNWEEDWIQRYKNILSEADDIVYVAGYPGRNAFFARNEWMVDNSARLIAVFTGAPGGTKMTIAYAKRNHREIVNMCSN